MMTAAEAPISDVGYVSPLSLGHDHDSHSHTVQFYAEDESLLDKLSGFVGKSLDAGDAAVVIATKAHRDGVARRLKARGLDPIALRKQGRYVSVDAEEILSKFLVKTWSQPALFAKVLGDILYRARTTAARANCRVAAFGEIVALLWARGKFEAAIQLEQLWDGTVREHGFAFLCAYPMDSFDRSEHKVSMGALVTVRSLLHIHGHVARLCCE